MQIDTGMTSTINVKTIQAETFSDYKKASMLICVCNCDWKCCKEAKQDICQNTEIAKQENLTVSIDDAIKSYINNPITEAIIFGGLEPMLQFKEVYSFIYKLRNQYNCNDDVIVYTGYYENEIQEYIQQLKQFKNIIVKFGRFISNDKSKYDNVLGVTLASHNQYAKQIS
jgi:pyruvate-formate lyase-activating enzyme